MDILSILGRSNELFLEDFKVHEKQIRDLIGSSSFLVVGGAGSIGQATSLKIFSEGAKCLHVVDNNENNLVELTRRIRSSRGYTTKDYKTFTLDIASDQFLKFFEAKGHVYDYVLNFSALKHVRSEGNSYTLSNMIKTNVLNSINLCRLCEDVGIRRYFCVSSDKAAAPANLMGATKRAMELCHFTASQPMNVSSARFANVAFSNGSLLDGFRNRLYRNEPITFPTDIKRYFMTEDEAGTISLLSTLLGGKNEIFFPHCEGELKAIGFQKILERFLSVHELVPFFCESEDEARHFSKQNRPLGKWPVYAFSSDTTGEKSVEEFYTSNEMVNTSRFNDIGIISTVSHKTRTDLVNFETEISKVDISKKSAIRDFVDIFENFIPEFIHQNSGKNLNEKM